MDGSKLKIRSCPCHTLVLTSKEEIQMRKIRIGISVFLLTSLACLLCGSGRAAATWEKDDGRKEVGVPENVAAPAFRALDQFGKEQSEKTVGGTNGTVLLFFRSADW
jgi:hypothetical protein